MSSTLLPQALLLHTAVTLVLVGLIWTIQIVHYPLFHEVGPAAFPAYHLRHMWLISCIAGPLMVAEVVSAVGVLYLGNYSPLYLFSLGALGAVWLSTFVYQVPVHARLAQGYDAEAIQQLVTTNWLRALAWTVRAGCLVALLWLEGRE
jgi:uncharacterized YccA/Bax inhibitor family protein